VKTREIEQAGHTFKDPGSPIAEAEYQPRVYGNPEQTLAAAFIAMKQDYGGPLPAGRRALRPYASIDAIDGGENTAPRSLR
jgi:hypothetical protein